LRIGYRVHRRPTQTVTKPHNRKPRPRKSQRRPMHRTRRQQKTPDAARLEHPLHRGKPKPIVGKPHVLNAITELSGPLFRPLMVTTKVLGTIKIPGLRVAVDPCQVGLEGWRAILQPVGRERMQHRIGQIPHLPRNLPDPPARPQRNLPPVAQRQRDRHMRNPRLPRYVPLRHPNPAGMLRISHANYLTRKLVSVKNLPCQRRAKFS